ncbi:methylated-DNA--[protein]-cysteine S-methyltransferase [Paenibacillus sp. NPDC056579]|uniref:methylated-DNA--[protein]-cysteine S-methyltransferase n=1 Tax=Paenibacillus sp. NPDC056579 TaxID=3345871 RepID=UPI0036A4B8E3
MESGNTIYWAPFQNGSWTMHIAATEKGLCYVNSPFGPFSMMADWLQKHYPGCTLVRDDDRMQRYSDELTQYLQGASKHFELPLDLHGTPFQRSVWTALLDIPRGATCSYSDIAESIGKGNAVRAVGAAIGANPALMVVPCHRVIGKNGALTGYRGGMEVKAELLRLEGIQL